MSKKKKIATKEERETNLLNVVPGQDMNTYLVLANWHDLPVDSSEINGCIVSVLSNDDSFELKILYQMEKWLFVLRKAAPNILLLGDVDGHMTRIVDDKIEIALLGLAGGISDIWVVDEKNYWISYESGLVHWNGQQLSNHIACATIEKIHGIASDFAVAVGAEGVVMVFNGATWHEVDLVPVNRQLIGVFCLHRNRIFISGWRGTLYEWDGRASWKKIKFVCDTPVSEINGGSIVQYLGDVYVCANEVGLFKINGAKAELVQDFYAGRAVVIHEKLIVTGGNLFVEFDGKNWSQMEIDLLD